MIEEINGVDLPSLDEALEYWSRDIEATKAGWNPGRAGLTATVLALYAVEARQLEDRVEELKRKAKGLEMTLGRYKKRGDGDDGD